MNIEGATIPVDTESTISSKQNTRIEDLNAVRVIFFAGDDEPPTVKHEMPSVKAFGGIFMPHIKTLPKANKGMLYRCQLTPLRTAYIQENKAMLPLDKREGGEWESGFVQKTRNADGAYEDKEVVGFMSSDVNAAKKGQFVQQLDTAYVFKKRYPGTDVRMAVKRSTPHGAGGIVEVTTLKGATNAEIHVAQLFFFPNWSDIQKGLAVLPETVRELENHIKDRLTHIRELSPDLQAKYRMIGADMLKSCTQFRVAYIQTFQKNEIVLKDAAVKGHTGAAFPEAAEQAMSMLEVRRKEDIVTGEASSVSELARIALEDRAVKKETDAKLINIEERKLYLGEAQAGFRERDENYEIQLGIRNADPSSAPVVAVAPQEPPQFVEDEDGQVMEVPSDTSMMTAKGVADAIAPFVEYGAVRLCGKPKANGEPCERKLVDGEDVCFQHK